MPRTKNDIAQPPDEGRARTKGDRTALIAAGVLAVACAIGAIRSTEAWAAFFAHPLVDRDITLTGATLVRVMMIATAIIVVLGTLGLTRLSRRGASLPQQTPFTRNRAHLYGLLSLIAIGFAFRAMRINESLWYDEIASWRTYNGGTQSFGAVIGAFLDPINHTLHTLLNRFSVNWLVGEVGIEIAFRAPALLFSLATIPVMFGLGQAAANERVAWLAAGIAACAPVCVLEGVEARGYSMMIFFSAAATWSLIVAFRSGSTLTWLIYALCCSLGVWSQFVTAWVAIGHGVWLVWHFVRAREDRERCAQGLIAIAIAGVISIMLHAPMIPGLLAWRDNFVAARPDQPRLLGLEGLHALLQLGGGWTWKSSSIGLALLATGVLSSMFPTKGEPSRLIARRALALSLIGMGLMLGVVVLSGTWLYARFMLFAMPGALLGMALGVEAAWSRRRALGVAAMGGLAVAGLYEITSLPPKQPLHDAVHYVQERAADVDRIVVVGLAHDVLSVYDTELNIADSFMFGRDLEAKLESLQPRWVIVQYPLHVPRDRYELLEARGYRKVAHFDGWADWGHGDVDIYATSTAR